MVGISEAAGAVATAVASRSPGHSEGGEAGAPTSWATEDLAAPAASHSGHLHSPEVQGQRAALEHLFVRLL